MTKKVALLIGCNYLGTSTELSGCINDILSIQKVLVNKFHYPEENIAVLRDDDRKASNRPTKENIIKALQRFVIESEGADEAWFHYSGHGSQLFAVEDASEIEDEVIVPLDYETAGFIIDNYLFSIVKQLKSKKSILLFDSCHSGSICDLEWGFQYNGVGLDAFRVNEKKVANPSVFVFSGCRDDETSADIFNPSQNRGYGAFTNAFVEALQGFDYNVDFQSLYIQLCRAMKEEGYAQDPVLSCSSSVLVGGLYADVVVPVSPPVIPVAIPAVAVQPIPNSTTVSPFPTMKPAVKLAMIQNAETTTRIPVQMRVFPSLQPKVRLGFSFR